MPGVQVVLEVLQDFPAIDVRQADVERDGIGFVLLGQLETGAAAQGDQSLEAPLVRHVQKDLGEVGIVLDDQKCAITRLNCIAVVHGLG